MLRVREQTEHFVRGEINVVFDGHLDAVFFPPPLRLPGTFGQALDLRPVHSNGPGLPSFGQVSGEEDPNSGAA